MIYSGCIKVLGSGCKSCHKLFDNATIAAEGKNYAVEYVTDFQKIMGYGVMSLPALVINEKVVSQGKILKPAESSALLEGK